jgi:hypothetical protein
VVETLPTTGLIQQEFALPPEDGNRTDFQNVVVLNKNLDDG